MSVLKWIIAVVALLVVGVLAAGQFGLLQGTRPDDLGVKAGRLKKPSPTPNSVSSQADLWPDHPQREGARIDPLPVLQDGPSTIRHIAGLVERLPGAAIVERRADYLYVQFTTPTLKFVDDAEFWFDPAAGVVQVRPASRVGRKDFGVNRARIEALRSRLAAGR